MAGELIVIALGGNAIKQPKEKGTTEEQFKNVDITAAQIAQLVKKGYQLVVTHGNGPQAGALLIQQEEAMDYVPPQTLAACGAMTQGQIGWMMQNRLRYHLSQQGIDRPICTIVTQVEVDENDPDFKDPTKPVGPFYTKDEALQLKKDWDYIVKEVKPGVEKPWRRVVPSPEPIAIVEEKSINELVEGGTIVIASGGGGIPVRKVDGGDYAGVDAVIDKDRAGFILSKSVGADKFVILTDVEKACLNFGKPEQKDLDKVTVSEMEKYSEEGHFLAGSMGPKVQAAMRFVKWSGKEAVITSLGKVGDAIDGKTGTHIVP